MKEFENLLTSTTLIPLWAKAVEANSENPILVDKYAYDTLKKLGYDLNYYDKKKQNPSQVGCCLRAKWLDDRTLDFVKKHDKCQVIVLGAGLDSRFMRIAMPEQVVKWYDLDLAEVMKMREKTLPAVERNEFLAMDMFDHRWMEELKATNLPTLVILEGVLMYFPEEDIKRLFHDIHEFLGDVTIIFDSLPQKFVGKAKYHDSVQKYNSKVEYKWSARSVKHLLENYPEIATAEMAYMSDLEKSNKFKFILRTVYKIPYFHNNFNQLLFKVEFKKK